MTEHNTTTKSDSSSKYDYSFDYIQKKDFQRD